MSRTPTRVYHRLSHARARFPPLRRYSNYCLDFDGGVNNQYVNCGVVPLTAPYTFLQWIWCRTAQITIWQKNFLRLYFGLEPITFILLLRASDGVIYNANTPVVLNQWNQVGIRVNSATSVDFVLNGVTDGNVVVVAGTVEDIIQILNIGFVSWTALYWDGLQDEISLIGRALTDQQLMESFLFGYAQREATSIMNLRFEEGSGLIAYDDSGLGNNGTLLPALTPPTWTEVMKHELLAEAGA